MAFCRRFAVFNVRSSRETSFYDMFLAHFEAALACAQIRKAFMKGNRELSSSYRATILSKGE